MGTKKNSGEVRLDGYGSNIFYSGADTTSDEEITFYAFLARRPAMAMLAATLNELISECWGVSADSFGIVALDFADSKSLRIVPMPDMEEEDDIALKNFLELLEEVIGYSQDVGYDDENFTIAAPSERSLLNTLKDFVESAELDLHPESLKDPASHFAEREGKRRKSAWKTVAEEGLRYAWVLASLPEQAYITREHLLGDVYRFLYSPAFDFKRIEATIAKTEAEQAGRPAPGTTQRALTFYLH